MASQQEIKEKATEIEQVLEGLDDKEKVAAVARAGVTIPSVGDMPDAFWSNMSGPYKALVFLGSMLILVVLLGLLLLGGVELIRDATKNQSTNEALLSAGNLILAAGIGLLGAGIGGGVVATSKR